ncbi:MAG: hypothetical protein HQL95_14420, partial [Magnetococcales bacterium]|nr:hypothetical protein [Magnetococcales bacterium]
LYTCASTLSALFESEIDSERPFFFRGDPGLLSLDLALPAAPDAPVDPTAPVRDLLMLRVDFRLAGKGVTGSLLTWMDGNGLPRLKTEIDHFITSHMA